MTPQSKLEFVDDLTTAIAKDIKAKILTGLIPPTWDGHELRALLAEKFAYEAARTLSRDGLMKPRSARLKDYRSAVATNNL